MKLTKSLTLIAIIFLLSKCGDEKDQIFKEENYPPQIENQEFSVNEHINDSDPIGTIIAFDQNNDPLTYSITKENDLFEITSNGGILSLKSGKSLDFESKTSHTFSVTVDDGTFISNADITVTVSDVYENSIPEISENRTFTVSEFITDDTEIGKLEVTDGDEEDYMEFSIVKDVSNLFEISLYEGVISLQEGKSLNYSLAASHAITVQVSDSKDTASVDITITVTDVDDDAFISVWKINDSSTEIELPIYLTTMETTTEYNFIVDWGDGTSGEVTSFNDTDAVHTYSKDSTYIVTISGTLVGFNFHKKNTESKYNIKDILQWGKVKLGNDGAVFSGCAYLEKFSAQDSPDLTNITNFSSFFNSAYSFNGDLSLWDVSNITNMSRMFEEAHDFNQDIGNWNVANVTDMSRMFYQADDFNQDIGNWNVANVTNMSYMFTGAGKFNHNIGNWNVANVTDMSYMFSVAENFNQDIGNWNVANVTSMAGMFNSASAFNQNIGAWDVKKVTDMNSMFSFAEAFNQDIGSWQVNEVQKMNSMFQNASSFNQDIGGWNISKVSNLSYMFQTASEFNQNIQNWDVRLVTHMTAMFYEAYKFNQNISDWNVSNVNHMSNMFNNALAFDQDLSEWNTTNVYTCNDFVSINTPIYGSDKLPTLGSCFAD